MSLLTHPDGVHIPEFGNNFSLQVSQVIYAGGAVDSSVKLSELVQYNLSSLFKSKHTIGRVVAEKREAADALALTDERVNTAIFAAQTDLKTAEEELVTCDKQVQLADENYSIVLNRYQNGLALVTVIIKNSDFSYTKPNILISTNADIYKILR